MINKKDERALIRILRFIKYNKLFALIVVIVLFMIIYIFFSEKGFLKRLKFQNEKEKIEEQTKVEKKKQDSLKGIIDSLTNSSEMIEKIAREKYFMTKEGELIYKLEYDTNDAK